MGLLLARLLGENQALILELLDWKKFQVRQIVYFPNGYCRRRCGFQTEISVVDLLVAWLNPKPTATAASPAVTHMTARRIEVSFRANRNCTLERKPGERCELLHTSYHYYFDGNNKGSFSISPRAHLPTQCERTYRCSFEPASSVRTQAAVNRKRFARSSNSCVM